MNLIKQKTGIFLCIFSLIILFLLRLPLNLSVICANENQGFAFTWGQSFLLWNELACGRGILFVTLFATVLKMFSFNTYSIIAIHLLETIILLVIGLLICFIVSRVLKSNFFGGLSTLLWVVLICTPIGKSSLIIEILSHYNLNEENLCVLFSLFSLLCLTLSNFFNTNQDSLTNTKEKTISFLAGFFAVCSLMSKASGAILLIATLIWFLLNAMFRKQYFKTVSNKIVYYFFGAISSLLFFNVLYIHFYW